MAETRAAWGIDIGQSALKAIKLRYIESAGQVVAEAFDYIAFPKILSQPDAIPEEIVPQAMETFLGRNNLKGNLVGISVPGQSALTRFIQLPPVEAGKLHEIVKYEARQQIPFALEDVIWDYQPLGAGAEQSGFLLDAEVGLFAMKRDQIAQYLRPYNNAKVEVELIQAAPLSLYNMLSFDELGIRRDADGEAGDDYYIILDMGCDNTTLLVTNGYSIWIRNVPIGGNHFTRALTKEMKLSFAKAEHLKCNATKSPDPRAVFQALRPVFNDYVSEIQRSVGYFSSVKRQAKIAKVVGLGNGFKLAGLQKFLQQNLQYEVDRPDAFRTLAGDAVVNSPLFADNILSFAVPYGLALQTLKLTRIRTSLLPPEIQTARTIKRKKPWAVAAAASLLLGYTLSTAGNAYTNSVVHTPEFAKAEKEAQDLGSKVSSLKAAYDGEVGRRGAAEARLSTLIEGRRDVHWLDVYNAIVDCLPRLPEGAPEPESINLKPLITLNEFSAKKESDVSNWFGKVPEAQLKYMTADDQANPPSGEGYVVTVRGRHYYNNPDEPTNAGILFVKNTFLNSLHQQQIHREGYPTRDVRRLGIHHATIMEQGQAVPLQIDVKGRDLTASRTLSGTNRFGTPGGPGAPGSPDEFAGSAVPEFPGAAPGLEPGAGAARPGSADVKVYPGTTFTIQFVLQYKPEEEREDLTAVTEGEEPAADDAATTEAAGGTE